MRYFNVQKPEYISQFVPDTTNWEMFAKLAEKNNQEYDKAELEAEKLANIVGGPTTKDWEKEVNNTIEQSKLKFKEAFNNNNLYAAKKALYEGQQAYNSAKAIAAKEDYLYSKANSKDIQKGIEEAGTFQKYYDRKTNSFIQATDPNTFNPIIFYSAVAPGEMFKEHQHIYNVVKPKVLKSYTDEGFETVIDPNTNKPILYNKKTGEKVSTLDRNRFLEVGKEFLKQEHLTSPFSQAIRNRIAWNPDYNMDNYLEDFADASAPYWNINTEELPPIKQIMKSSGKSGNDNSSKEELVTSNTTDLSTIGKIKIPIKDATGNIVEITPKSAFDNKRAIDAIDIGENINEKLKGLQLTPLIFNNQFTKEYFEKQPASYFKSMLKQKGLDEASAEVIGQQIYDENQALIGKRQELIDLDNNITQEVLNRAEFKGLDVNSPENKKVYNETVKKVLDDINKLEEEIQDRSGGFADFNPSHFASMAAEKGRDSDEIKLVKEYQEIFKTDLTDAQKEQYKKEFLAEFTSLRARDELADGSTKIGRALAAINKEHENHYNDYTQFLVGTNLENTYFDKEKGADDKVGKRLKNQLSGLTEVLSRNWTDVFGNNNDKIKAEYYKDGKLTQNIKTEVNDIFWDIKQRKYKARVQITPIGDNQETGIPKVIYMDVTNIVSNPDTNKSTSLANTTWHDNNIKQADIYDEIKNLKGGNSKYYNQSVFGNKIKVTNNRIGYTIEVNGIKNLVPKDNFKKLSEVISAAEGLVNNSSPGGARVGEPQIKVRQEP